MTAVIAEDGVKFTGEIRQMNENGDLKVRWDVDNEAEVEVARTIFNEARQRGMAAAHVAGGSARPVVVQEFDPTAERYVLIPALQGG